MKIEKNVSTLADQQVPITGVKLHREVTSMVVSICTGGQWVEVIVMDVGHISHQIGTHGMQAKVEHSQSNETR